MKHKWAITIILLSMFLAAQLIGIFVINAYSPHQETQIVNGTSVNVTITPELPYGMQPPAVEPGFSILSVQFLISVVIAFVFAILLMFLLIKIKTPVFLRIWFFVVVVLGLSIAINAFLKDVAMYSSIIAFLIALPLGIIKIFKRNILVHNLTELLIYPGIAAVFVPIFSVWSIIAILIIISAYDIYAVWHSGFMQKLAKYQINKVKVFGGFFVPYIPRKIKEKLKKMSAKQRKKKKIKVGVAMLGGGDVVFPMITAGVVLRTLGIFPALVVTLCATVALLLLFLFSQKGKFYPAMPFISAGLFVGIVLAYVLF